MPNHTHYFLELKGRTDLAKRKDLKKRHEFFRHARGGSYVEWRSNTEIEVMFTPHPTRENYVKKKKSKIRDTQIKITDPSTKSLLRKSTASPIQ